VRKKYRLPKFSKEADGWKDELVSNWPRQCGFCGVPLLDWEARAKHVVDHFLEGHNISEWKIPFPRPKGIRSERTETSHNGNDDDENDDDSEDDGSYDTDPDFGAVMDENTGVSGQPQIPTSTRSPRSGAMWRTRSVEDEKFQVATTHCHHEYNNGATTAKETWKGKTPSNTILQLDQVSRRNRNYTPEVLVNPWIKVPKGSISLQKYLSEQQLHERLLLGVGRVPNVTCPLKDTFKDTARLLPISKENNEPVLRRPNERAGGLESSTLPILVGKSERRKILNHCPQAPSIPRVKDRLPYSLQLYQAAAPR
jgi:hypothetical protein